MALWLTVIFRSALAALAFFVYTPCPLQAIPCPVTNVSSTVVCSKVHCRFPCEPAPNDNDVCTPICVCPKTPQEACNKIQCVGASVCRPVCYEDRCEPYCKPVGLLSMMESETLISSPSAGFEPCPVVACRFPCEPSPPNRHGCPDSCVCPITVERACTKLQCPNHGECAANCDDCVCIPYCKTGRNR